MSRTPPSWRRYLRFWGPDPAADIDEEFAFHIEMRVEELVSRGMSPEAARADVLRRFGNIANVKRTCKEFADLRETTVRRSEWWRGWWQDARYGWRQIVTSPMSSLVLIFTLALGIGATVSIFSVVYAVVLRPLPYAT